MTQKELKTETVRFKVSPSALEAFERCAERERMSVNAWARRQVEDAAEQPEDPPETQSQFKELLARFMVENL